MFKQRVSLSFAKIAKIHKIRLPLQKNITLMKNTLYTLILLASLTACHENIEKRAAREAREYTEKFCPTPVVNYTRTDSVAFDESTKTYNYYCSVTDIMDDEQIIGINKENIRQGLLEGIRQNTELIIYKKANFNFAYTLYSSKQPGKILFAAKYTPEDYDTQKNR